MAEVATIDIKGKKPSEYLEMITAAGQDAFEEEGGIALGITVDNKPAGALCAELEDGVARLTSIYVVPEFRRRGLGTELVYQASEAILKMDNTYCLETRFPENKAYPSGLKEFFTYLDFEMSEAEELGAYTVMVKDAFVSKVLKKASAEGVQSMSKLSRADKAKLLAQVPGIDDYEEIRIDESLSCAVPGKAADDADCVVVGREGEELVILWARAFSNKLNLVKMLKYMIDKASVKYPMDTRIRIPYISGSTKDIIIKMLEKEPEKTEIVWDAVLSFGWEEGEEEEEIL